MPWPSEQDLTPDDEAADVKRRGVVSEVLR